MFQIIQLAPQTTTVQHVHDVAVVVVVVVVVVYYARDGSDVLGGDRAQRSWAGRRAAWKQNRRRRL